MFLKSEVKLTLFLVFVFQIFSGFHPGSCTTPQNKTCDCVSIHNCVPFFGLILYGSCGVTEARLSQKDKDFIEKSVCGVDDDGEKKVCCSPLPPEYSNRFSKKHWKSLQLTVTTEATVDTEIIIDPVEQNDSYPEPRNTCGRDSGVDRIIGGTSADLEEFPWMALLRYRNLLNGDMSFICGGALLNQRYVLTAAHCLQVDPEFKLVTVRLGENNILTEHDCREPDDCADPVQDLPVQAAYLHPEYSYLYRNKQADIGLVRLSRRAKYNDYVHPICLVDLSNSKSKAYAEGSATVVSGWGKTEFDTFSAVKQKLDLQIYDSEKCFSLFKRKCKMNLTDKHLCAGGVIRRDSCSGDSGGPLMRIVPGDTWEAIGVVSFGNKCAMDGWPAVYTSVARYVDWIKSTIKETNV